MGFTHMDRPGKQLIIFHTWTITLPLLEVSMECKRYFYYIIPLPNLTPSISRESISLQLYLNESSTDLINVEYVVMDSTTKNYTTLPGLTCYSPVSGLTSNGTTLFVQCGGDLLYWNAASSGVAEYQIYLQSLSTDPLGNPFGIYNSNSTLVYFTPTQGNQYHRLFFYFTTQRVYPEP